MTPQVISDIKQNLKLYKIVILYLNKWGYY